MFAIGHKALARLFQASEFALPADDAILIGQYDSPFVRRVGIALTLYGCRSSTGRGRPSATPTRSGRSTR